MNELYLAADMYGEWLYDARPVPDETATGWGPTGDVELHLPTGTIERLIGRKLRFEDGPVKFNKETLLKP